MNQETGNTTRTTPWLVLIGLIGALAMNALFNTGCMQVLGTKHIDAWGLKIDSTAGFDVSAGVMQYDHALDRKGYNVEAKDNKHIEGY